MITVGTTVVSGSPINGGGGAGLPVASGAGEVPLSTGAGTAYAAANFGDEVSAIITDAIGGTAGQALIGDGACFGPQLLSLEGLEDGASVALELNRACFELRDTLRDGSGEVKVEPAIAELARVPIERMVSINP